MRKALRILAVILLVYILQTTVLPRFTVLEIQPDILLAMLIALTLDGDRYVGFCSGAVVGLVMDTMVGQLPFLYLITYPLMGYLAATISPFLLDKLPRPKRAQKLVSARLFTRLVPMITAAMLALAYELALLVYRYLNAMDITADSISRMLRFTLYTAVSTFFMQFLVRYCMSVTLRINQDKEGSR